MLSIGLMSGTSMDGIDAALIQTDDAGTILKELDHISIEYKPSFKMILKATEYAIRIHNGDLGKASSQFFNSINAYLSTELNLSATEINPLFKCLRDYLGEKLSLDEVINHSTRLHAEAVKKLLIQAQQSAKNINIIGYHGQTMFHRPQEKCSIILGDGQYLADDLQITVVNDFRSQDIAYGGVGAPLAPLYHQALAIRDKLLPTVVVNCGGIANLTLINNANEFDLIAYDTGPGNGLIDRLVRQRTQGKEHMDKDGRYGKKGRVDQAIITALYDKSILLNNQSYYSMLPPKALDIGDMELIPELHQLSLEDACATLEAFTADTIVQSLDLLNTSIPKRWILAGGGWSNPVIRAELERRLKNKLGEETLILTANEAGWNNQAMEAQLFAFLAIRSLQNKPLTFPNTTKVSSPQTGGHLWQPTY